MTYFTQYEMLQITQNKLGIDKYTSETVEQAVVAALTLTPYVKYVDDPRAYFFGVISKVSRLISMMNEVKPFDTDRAKKNAFDLFLKRYSEVIRPTASVICDDTNTLAKAFRTLYPINEECPELLSRILELFRNSAREAFIEKTAEE